MLPQLGCRPSVNSFFVSTQPRRQLRTRFFNDAFFFSDFVPLQLANLHAFTLQRNSLFSNLILGSVFSDYVVVWEKAHTGRIKRLLIALWSRFYGICYGRPM